MNGKQWGERLWAWLHKASGQIQDYTKRFWAWLSENPLLFFLSFLLATVFSWIILQTIKLDNMGFTGKSFWDWLELLIVPAILALGAYWLGSSQKKTELEIARKERETEREIARDRREQATLDAYFDRMSELLINYDLGNKTESDSQEPNIARTRTLAVLRNLDGERKGQVVQFLYDAGLIKGETPIICMSGADLSGALLANARLEEINLYDANLRGADFSFTVLRDANMSWANLIGAKLLADLRNANLASAYLNEAQLLAAKLQGAHLNRVQFNNADLSNAHLEGADLSQAHLLIKAKMQDAKYDKRTIWPTGFKPEPKGAVLVEQDELDNDR